MAEQIRPSTLEKDKDFAHTIALRLNGLIDKGVITKADAVRASADDEIVFDLMQRSHLLIDPLSSPVTRDKIRCIVTSEMLADESFPSRERMIEFAHAFLGSLKESGWKIKGFLLFGSRLDQSRKLHALSDLDVIPVLDMSNIELARESGIARRQFDAVGDIFSDDAFPEGFQEEPYCADLDIVAGNFCRKHGWQDMADVYVAVSGLLNEELLLKELRLEGKDVLPPWGWKPRSVHFVGELTKMGEAEVNRLIQEALTSKRAEQVRKKAVGLVRELFRKQFSDRGSL